MELLFQSMKTKSFLFTLFFCLGFSLSPVTGVLAQEATQVLTEADSGKAIYLTQGEKVDISLDENDPSTMPWEHIIYWFSAYNILLGEQHDQVGNVTYDGVISTPTYDSNFKLIKTTFSFYGNQPGQVFLVCAKNWARVDSSNLSNMVSQTGAFPVKSMLSFFINVNAKDATSLPQQEAQRPLSQ